MKKAFLILFIFLAFYAKSQNWDSIIYNTYNYDSIMYNGSKIWTKAQSCGSSVTIDGTEYSIVSIGGQCWLGENLHYDDGGSDIYSYNDDTAASDTLGYLYTYSSALRVAALVSGWHLPTKTEMDDLVSYVGGSTGYAGTIKETGFVHWDSPNTGATNSTGFTAWGVGVKGISAYTGINTLTKYWSSTSLGAGTAYTMGVSYNSANFTLASYTDTYRYSVRLIKD